MLVKIIARKILAQRRQHVDRILSQKWLFSSIHIQPKRGGGGAQTQQPTSPCDFDMRLDAATMDPEKLGARDYYAISGNLDPTIAFAPYNKKCRTRMSACAAVHSIIV